MNMNRCGLCGNILDDYANTTPIHRDCARRAVIVAAELTELKQKDGRLDGLENSNFEYITRTPLELSRAINIMLRCDVKWQENFLRWLKEERETWEGAE